MFTVEYIENLYCNSRYGSADFVISEFLLMNIDRLTDISLSEIARSTGFPKSTVSLFFSAYGLQGGYLPFQRALQVEISSKAVPIAKHLTWCRNYSRLLKSYKAVSVTAIRRISRAMLSSGKVIFVGPIRYKTSFTTLIFFLRSLNIKAKFIINGNIARDGAELKEMTDKDLTIILVPGESYMEHKYRNESYPQYAKTIQEAGGRKVYICSKNDSGKDDVKVALFKCTSNPYEWPLSMSVFAADLFEEVLTVSGTDPEKSLYVL